MVVDTLRRVASFSPPDNCVLKVRKGGAVKLISYTTLTFMYHSMNLSTPNNNIHARGASHTTDC